MRATYLSSNPIFHGSHLLALQFPFYARMKHVEIDFHFIYNRVLIKSLQVAYIYGKDQLANALTKPLFAARLASMCSILRLQHLPLDLRMMSRLILSQQRLAHRQKIIAQSSNNRPLLAVVL